MNHGAPARPAGAAVAFLRDRLWVVAGLAVVTLLAWAYLLVDAARMHAMTSGDAVAMMAMQPTTATDLLLLFLMWSVMMAAMMVPTVIPAVLIYVAIVRRMAPHQSITASTTGFVTGYLLVWAGFSLIATGLQWTFGRLALLSPEMVASSPFFGGALLIAAGAYQFSPLKKSCLKHCQAPIVYLAQHWRSGVQGALAMGVRHGAYCVGCCWAIMGLLFVGGIMNLLWVAAIAIFVLLEKLALLGGRLGLWLSGLAATASGLALIIVTAYRSV